MGRFGSSGIRGVFNEGLSLEVIADAGKALGELHGDVVVGNDVRISRDALKAAFAAGVMSTGADVYDCGLVTTPTLAYETVGYSCGVMFTASHNPPEYNGMKMWKDRRAFNSAEMRDVDRLMDTGKFRMGNHKTIGTQKTLEGALQRHKDFILSNVGRVGKLKVIADPGCGAASVITPYVLKELGCDVTTINSQPDGEFPGRPSEPSQANLKSLCKVTKELGADIGIANDGDADRMVVVGPDGVMVPNDVLLAMFARHLGAKRIVMPVDSSMAIGEYLEGVKIEYCKVGDVYVAERLNETNADFGGEASGTWIFPRISMIPDGVLAAAVISQLVSSGGGIKEMTKEIARYPMKRTAVALRTSTDELAKTLDNAIEKLEPANVDRTDGVKLVFDDAWALVRPSGTEPKVRITVEGHSDKRVDELSSQLASIIGGQ